MIDQATENTFSALRFFLVGAIFRLSVDADAQAAYLDGILDHLTENCDATDYGNDELALELDDAYSPLRNRSGPLRLTKEEKKKVDALDSLLGRLSGENFYAFWRREALASDYRWMEVRKLAKLALKEFEKAEELPPKEHMLRTSSVVVKGG